MNNREALKQTFKRFQLVQAEISRRTEELENQGKGKKVQVDQLNRYLKGKRDLYNEAFETVIKALDEVPRAFFKALAG